MKRLQRNIRDVDVLFVDVLPFRHSTRTRKMALALSEGRPKLAVAAITLQQVGRIGIKDLRAKYLEGAIRVRQVSVPTPRSGVGLKVTMINLGFVYMVGLLRLVRAVLSVRATTIVVGSTSLFWLGRLHHYRFGSKVVLNARERLGGIRTPGSIGTLVSRVEPFMIRGLGKSWVTTTCVCESHAREFRSAGAHEVIVVRNVPLRAFIPAVWPSTPAGGPLTVALVGSLYPGRGIEPLIRAVGLLKQDGSRVNLQITGLSGNDYGESLRRLIDSEGVQDRVYLMGPCPPDEVPQRYAMAHIGTALYEAIDSANDSLSNKIFECVASGRGVLAGNLPENVALVEAHSLGWAVPVNVEGLRKVLHMLIAERPNYDVLGQHCLEQARNALNWEVEVGPLLRVLLDER